MRQNSFPGSTCPFRQFFWSFLFSVLIALPVLAGAAAAQTAGSVKAMIPDASRNAHPLAVNDTLQWNDLLQTDAKGRLRAGLTDGSILSVGSNSQLKVVQHDASKQQTAIELNYGKLRSEVTKITQPQGKYQVKTANAVIGVIGTDFYVGYAKGRTTVICYEGTVSVTPIGDTKVLGSTDAAEAPDGGVILRAGQIAIMGPKIARGETLLYPVLMRAGIEDTDVTAPGTNSEGTQASGESQTGNSSNKTNGQGSQAANGSQLADSTDKTNAGESRANDGSQLPGPTSKANGHTSQTNSGSQLAGATSPTNGHTSQTNSGSQLADATSPTNGHMSQTNSGSQLAGATGPTNGHTSQANNGSQPGDSTSQMKAQGPQASGQLQLSDSTNTTVSPGSQARNQSQPTDSSKQTNAHNPQSDGAQASDSASQTNTDKPPTKDEAQLASLINQTRSEKGLPPLVVDPRLTEAARKHTKLMAENGALTHQFPEEPRLQERIDQENIPTDLEAENVGWDVNVVSAHQSLVDDPPHLRNILDPNCNVVGVAVIRRGNHIFVTEDFAHLVPENSQP